MAVRGTRIRQPENLYAVVKYWAKRKEENFLTVTLDGAHNVIKVHHITKGLVEHVEYRPFRKAEDLPEEQGELEACSA